VIVDSSREIIELLNMNATDTRTAEKRINAIDAYHNIQAPRMVLQTKFIIVILLDYDNIYRRYWKQITSCLFSRCNADKY
jgi:hypothetical protein